MPVPGLSLLGLKRIRGFVSILRYINPTIIIMSQSQMCLCQGCKGRILTDKLYISKCMLSFTSYLQWKKMVKGSSGFGIVRQLIISIHRFIEFKNK